MEGEERLNGISSWEEQCADAAERELNDLEEKLAAERAENSQRIWLSFQNAANAVAQLFRERGEDLHSSSLWTPFQDTANLVTILYKGIKTPVDKKMLSNKNSPGLFPFNDNLIKVIPVLDNGIKRTVIRCFSEPCIYSIICILRHSPKQMYCTKAVSSDEIKDGCVVFDDEFEM